MRSRATSIGIEARRAIGAAVQGEVAAVFRTSFYIRSGDGWACFGSGALGRGPLNIPCIQVPHDWRRAVRVGAPASLRCGAVTVCGHEIVLGDAPVWAPGLKAPSDCASRAGGLEALSRWLPARLPQDGLAAFLHRQAVARTLVETAARPAIEALALWAASPAEDATAPPLTAVCALMGLGPGLTPSGDDFLAGFIVALRAVGQGDRSSALSRMIADNLSLTSALSAAHLQAAMRAGLSEDMDSLLAAILAGDASATRAAIEGGLLAGTHNSPWDALAGIVTALRSDRRAEEACNEC